MKVVTKTRSVGGSLVVTIPSEIVKEEMLKENEVVEIEVKKHKRDFFGALKGIGKFTEEDRMEDRN
ncbi:MAG: AbrB/MazE/SpoVT family DNA-binding domain-containing protein [Nanoarchaeota archaeon]